MMPCENRVGLCPRASGRTIRFMSCAGSISDSLHMSDGIREEKKSGKERDIGDGFVGLHLSSAFRNNVCLSVDDVYPNTSEMTRGRRRNVFLRFIDRLRKRTHNDSDDQVTHVSPSVQTVAYWPSEDCRSYLKHPFANLYAQVYGNPPRELLPTTDNDVLFVDQFMRCPVKVIEFQKYLGERHCGEGIGFYWCIQLHKQLKHRDELLQSAAMIFDVFVNPEGCNAVNLDQKQVRHIQAQLENPTPDMFDHTFFEVFYSMFRGLYSNFMKSMRTRNMVKSCEDFKRLARGSCSLCGLNSLSGHLDEDN